MTLPGSRVEGRAAQIERAAADWLERVDAEGRPEDPMALERWLGESPRHRAAYLRLLIAWRHARALRRLAMERPEPDADLLERSRWVECEPLQTSSDAREVELWQSFAAYRRRKGVLVSNVSREALVGAASHVMGAGNRVPAGGAPDVRVHHKGARSATVVVVASFAVAFVAIAAWIFFNGSVGARTYSTQIGEVRRVPLDDGSTVALNTDSEIRVRYRLTSRHVDLLKGEALFTVAKSRVRPFDVQAGKTTVRAVGTEFSVRLRDTASSDRVDVVVVEGHVAINPPSTRDYAAGIVATVENGRIDATHVGVSAVDDHLAWTTTGKLHFEDESLENVVAEMNRYNTRKLVIASPEVGRIRIGGTFEARDPDALARALRDRFVVDPHFYHDDSGAVTIVLEAREP